MRVITPTPQLKNMDPVDYLEATVLKIVMDIGKATTYTNKDIQALKMMGELLLAIKKNNREEYALLLKSGIKDDASVDKKVLKEIEKLLLEKGE